MFHSTECVTGGILWANLHLLFWVPLFPSITAWVGANHLAPMPAAVYDFVLLMVAIAYYILQHTIIAQQGKIPCSRRRLGTTGRESSRRCCILPPFRSHS
jgi:uncharacterized membrane protein